VRPSAATPTQVSTDVLNIVTNYHIGRMLDRLSDKPSGSPLIIRHVAGSDGKKTNVHQDPAATGPAVDGTSNADRCDDDSARAKELNEMIEEFVDQNKKMAAGIEIRAVADAKDEAEVTAAAGGGDKFTGIMTVLDHEISQGHNTTNAADRALCVAPFTHASYAVSLMCSEVVGGADDDDEACDGNVGLGQAAPTTLSKSPHGSSSSAQLSGQRSVQHMLKQIQDAGERINERISARDFGARRRLPVVPIDVVDSDLPTSSQSAKSDGSGGETQPEHRPVRSVLEEFHRPAIRSPKSWLKNSTSPSVIQRQLPDPLAIKQTAGTDSQSTEPDKLSGFSPCDRIGKECDRRLFDPSSAMSLGPDGCLLNAASVTQPKKLSEQLHNGVDSIVTKHSESKPDAAEVARFQDSATENDYVPVLTSTQSLYDPDLLAYAVNLIAAESRLGNAKCSDSADNIAKLIDRGTADGESPGNTVNDEADNRTGLSACLQCPVSRLSDIDIVPACEQSAAIPHSYSSVECIDAELGARKIATSLESACDQMCRRYLLPSDGVWSRTDVVIEDESKCAPNINGEYVCKDSLVKLPRSPHATHATSLDVAELVWSDSQKVNVFHDALVNCELLAAVSVPTTSCTELNNAAADACLNGNGKNNSVTAEHDSSFLLHDNIHANSEVNAKESVHSISLDAAAFATAANKSKSVDDWLFAETDHDIKLCQETSKLSTLVAASPVPANEQNVRSSSMGSDKHMFSGAKDEESFCLAGPKRALCNTLAVVSSASAVVKTSSQQPFTAQTPVVSLASSALATNGQLTCVHTPVLRSTNSPQTAAVCSSAQKHVAVSHERKLVGSIAVKVNGSTLSHVTGLPPPIRLSSHSPQPPTVPASRPAAAAAQARSVTVQYRHSTHHC